MGLRGAGWVGLAGGLVASCMSAPAQTPMPPAPGGDGGTADAPVRELVLFDQVFARDTMIEVDRLVVRAGAHVRVEPRVLLWIRTRTVMVEGEGVIDASGVRGEDRGVWTSSTDQCGYLQVGHREWLAADDRPEHVGGAGGAGGQVEIRYHELAGGSAELRAAQLLTAGGEGGRGMRLVCGCHPETESRASPQGPAGPDGSGQWVRE